MTLQECYFRMEADYEDVIRRLGKEERIRRFLFKLPEEKSFSDLSAAIETENQEEAFRAAHSLKGISLNLSLTRLYGSSNLLTEALRNFSSWEEVHSLFFQVSQDYQEIVECIRNFTGNFETI